MKDKADFGIIGLGVMGKSLALNIEDKGHHLALYDLNTEGTRSFVDAQDGKHLRAFESLEAMVEGLDTPRRILLMVPSGKPVDQTLGALRPLLEKGDIVIDGGNTHFSQTEARQADYLEDGLHLIGMGISGGEEGARHGPSMMPGGDENAWKKVRPVLESIAAQVEDGPCVTYMGPGGAGHFVKMVHNGIEYADMQLIAETYDLLKNVGGLDNTALAAVFEGWNDGELESFLVEITAKVLAKPDDKGGGSLVDQILDTAKMKGTGSWTVEQGIALATPVSVISAAVEARVTSGLRDLRLKAAEVLSGPEPTRTPDDCADLVSDAASALYAAKVCAYAQGMGLLAAASRSFEWDLRLDEIARIWKGGCIIRARLLERIQAAYAEGGPHEDLLLMDDDLLGALAEREQGLRNTLRRCQEQGIAAPALGAALSYYDAMRRPRGPANLIQAQRDCFGAHKYQRLDEEGTFHTEW